MRKLSIKILVVVGLVIAGLLVWRQLSGVAGAQDKKEAVKVVQQTPDKMKQMITSAHTRVFSKDNLLVANIDKQEQKPWDELVEGAQRDGKLEEGIQQFVERNYKEEMGDFETIKKASDQLLATLQTTYQYISQAFVTAKDKTKGLSSFDLKKIDIKKLNAEEIFDKLKVLVPYRDQLVQLQASLDAKAQEIKKSWTPKIKREVCEVLSFFAMSVELAINKALGDTLPLLEQRLTDVSTRLFGRDNLLLVDITNRDERAWHNLLGEIKVFISYNDQAFLGDYTIIADAGSQLITTLQSLYKHMKKTIPLGMKKAPKAGDLNLNKVRASDITSQLRQEMSSFRNQITTLQQSLDQKIKNYTKDTPRPTKTVSELLLKFATIVKNAIEKVVDNTAVVFPQFAFAVRRM